MSFVAISWALLDYHRALRTCLPSKPLLGLGSSVIYFLWNLLLLWPRVLAVALFLIFQMLLVHGGNQEVE